MTNRIVKTNLSYGEYIKSQLELISNQLSVKTYKLGTEKYPIPERGRDLRIAFVWTYNNKKHVLCQFLIEKTFWFMQNTNDADRIWMQNQANIWLNKFRDMVKDIKDKQKLTTKTKKKKKIKIGETQMLFDKAKRDK